MYKICLLYNHRICSRAFSNSSQDRQLTDIGRKWNVQTSAGATRIENKLRNMAWYVHTTPNPAKTEIHLRVGDPSLLGNLPPAEEAVQAVITSLKKGHHGYYLGRGSEEGRHAVSTYHSNNNIAYTPDDVVLTSGCTQSVEMVMLTLVNPGESVLVPRPGYPVYGMMCGLYGFRDVPYNLLPGKRWEIDLRHLESKIDQTTRLIVVNNPSNPCGSVYSESHLRDICSVARRHRIPILADEVYGDIAFPPNVFHHLGNVCEEVPVFSGNSLSKKWLTPGWRIGWILTADRDNKVSHVKTQLNKLADRTLAPSAFLDRALPDILNNVPREFYAKTIKVLQNNAEICQATLSECPGLRPIAPQGSMFMLVGIEIASFPFKTDQEFIDNLIEEESVFCYPSEPFMLDNYFRVMLGVTPQLMSEATSRISEFCKRHYVATSHSVDRTGINGVE